MHYLEFLISSRRTENCVRKIYLLFICKTILIFLILRMYIAMLFEDAVLKIKE